MTGAFREYVWKQFKRDSRWPKLRATFLKSNPKCAACESSKNLQVHHILPVHKYPTLELMWVNLITLCGDCHHTIGHCRSWHKWNKNALHACKMIRAGMTG